MYSGRTFNLGEEAVLFISLYERSPAGVSSNKRTAGQIVPGQDSWLASTFGSVHYQLAVISFSRISRNRIAVS